MIYLLLKEVENMRYYGEDYKNALIKNLVQSRDSIDWIDYSSIIRQSDVSSQYAYLKSNCLNAAGKANTHINFIREKFTTLIEFAGEFYNESDETAECILDTAKSINDILEEVNSTLVQLNNAINNVGEYSGERITPELIKSAGLKEEKCLNLKSKVWDNIFDMGTANNSINDETLEAYVDYIIAINTSNQAIPDKDKNKLDNVFNRYIQIKQDMGSDNLSSNDRRRLSGIHDYYVANRVVEDLNYNTFDEQIFHNCVNAYELIEPKSKELTDDLFSVVYEKNDDQINLNILRIKYAMYTTDIKSREIMFYYMPYFIVELREGAKATFSAQTETIDGVDKTVININLRQPDKDNTNFCSFFHEYGHGIDYMSVSGNGHASDGYNSILISDLKNHFRKTLAKYNVHLYPNEEQALFDYIFSSENSNMVDIHGVHWPLPENWNAAQIDAFNVLKKYYGYKEYTFDPHEELGFRAKGHEGYTSGTDAHANNSANYYANISAKHYGIREDIIGGLTNNKFGADQGHHADDRLESKQITVHSLIELHDSVIANTRWYQNDVLTDNTAFEFFAECWEYRVLGYDLGPVRDAFGESCDHFNESVDKIWNDIPH